MTDRDFAGSLVPIARGLALFLALFTIANVAGELQSARDQANIWWIHLPLLQPRVSRIVLLVFALFMLAYAVAPPRHRWRRTTNLTLLAVVGMAALSNAFVYYALLRRGEIATALPFPFSLIVVLTVATIAIAHRYTGGNDARSLRTITTTALMATLLFPLAQISLLGMTDYRRPADYIVVFGARAFQDGTPSPALADRLRTAIALYRAGLAPKLVFSGGPGDVNIDEPESMRRFAVRHGVPHQAIILDSQGLNTEATVRNTITITGKRARILAVSHFYHLPRVKMTFQRFGMNVYSVPAGKTTIRLRSMPFLLAREVAAFWSYYLRFFRSA